MTKIACGFVSDNVISSETTLSQPIELVKIDPRSAFEAKLGFEEGVPCSERSLWKSGGL
jgi:hypothetical protein